MMSKSPQFEKAPGASLAGVLCALALVALLGALGVRFLFAQAAPETKLLLPRTTVILSVPCRADPKQSYALYIPSTYTPERRWPIVYGFAPDADGEQPVSLMKDAAEKYGYLVVGSNNSRNGPRDLEEQAAQAIWRDTHERFALDKQRVYFTGLSGGARAATSLADACGNCAAGVFLQGAGFPSSGLPKEKISFSVFASVGVFDFNYPELVQLQQQLDARGVPNRLRRFPGRHEWAPPEIWMEATEWMELMAMKQGRREKDADFIAHELERETGRAKAFENAGDLFSAYQEYRQTAQDFAGLADTAAIARRAAESSAPPRSAMAKKAKSGNSRGSSGSLASSPVSLPRSATIPWTVRTSSRSCARTSPA